MEKFEKQKEKLLKELEKEINNDKKQIKELEEKVKDEMFLKSTVNGGAFSNMARNACDRRANAATGQKLRIKERLDWEEEMVSKYK